MLPWTSQCNTMIQRRRVGAGSWLHVRLSAVRAAMLSARVPYTHARHVAELGTTLQPQPAASRTMHENTHHAPCSSTAHQTPCKPTNHRGCLAVWPGPMLCNAPLAARRALSCAVAASMVANPLTFSNIRKQTRAPVNVCTLRSPVCIRSNRLPLQCGLRHSLL